MQSGVEPFGTGFVDAQGKVVIAFQDQWKVEATWGLHEGMARVYSNGQTGYIDKTGPWSSPRSTTRGLA
ncbi:MAG: WG repeat-containing protein [Anaerolineae bacterium]